MRRDACDAVQLWSERIVYRVHHGHVVLEGHQFVSFG
jgi:hypothetical protein